MTKSMIQKTKSNMGKTLSLLALSLLTVLILSACNKPASEKGKNKTQQKESATTSQQISTQEYLDAALEGKISIVEKAIDNGTNVNATGPNGNTALMLAAFNGNTDVVDLLIQNDAEVNIKDENKRTALIYAASGNNPETVQRLIDADADIDHADGVEKFTALMFAAAEGQTEVVKKLLDAGADKTLTDKDGDTALDFARNNNHKETVQLLSE